MANIFSGTEPPAWLQNQSGQAWNIGSQAGKSLGQSLGWLMHGIGGGLLETATSGGSLADNIKSNMTTLDDQKNQLELQQLRQRVSAGALDIQSKQLGLAVQNNEMAAWMRDQPKIADWQTMTPEQQMTTPLPSMESQRGSAIANNLQKNISSSIVAKSMVQTKSTYDKAVADLAKENPDLASGLFLSPNQFPRKENWDALNIGQQTAQVRTENKKGMAEIEALQRGDTATVKVGPKGVETTYKPVTTAEGGGEPKTKNLADGTTLAWIPGAKTIHVIKSGTSERREMSPFELRNLAKDLETANPSDTTAKQIRDFLSGTALNQITPKTNAPVAPKSSKVLDEATARQFLQKTGGDKDKARQMAKDAGYTW